MAMQVANLSAAPMDLMYMCHVNFAFAEGARLVQPLPFTPAHVVARTVDPRPCHADRGLARDARRRRRPSGALAMSEGARALRSRTRVLSEGRARVGPTGACATRCCAAKATPSRSAGTPRPCRTPCAGSSSTPDQSVAAFAMPATCEPEGYSAEKRKGHVRTLRGRQAAPVSRPRSPISRATSAAAIVAEIEEAAQ